MSRVFGVPERHGGRSMTDTTDYVPAEKRIRALLLAGKRLAEVRGELYDTHDKGAPAVSAPRFRDLSFDLADASELQRANAQRLRGVRDRVTARRKKILERKLAAQAKAAPVLGSSEKIS